MEKKISMQGVNGSFVGTIKINWDYKTEIVKGQNPSTHEDTETTFKVSNVSGVIHGTKFKVVSPDFTNENMVWQHVESIEQKIKIKLNELANVPEFKSVRDMLKEKGFI